MSEEKIMDSGKRESNATGALREPDEGKGHFELMSLYSTARLARWYELGSKKICSEKLGKGCFRQSLF